MRYYNDEMLSEAIELFYNIHINANRIVFKRSEPTGWYLQVRGRELMLGANFYEAKQNIRDRMFTEDEITEFSK